MPNNTFYEMDKLAQTHPKFIWRFAEYQQNSARFHTVIADTETAARATLPNIRLVFTARIREVPHE